MLLIISAISGKWPILPREWVRTVWRKERPAKRERLGEKIQRVISLFSLNKSERWRVGWVSCFYSNHTSSIFFSLKNLSSLWFASILLSILFGFISFHFEFSDEEAVAVVVFCFWCIVLGHDF